MTALDRLGADDLRRVVAGFRDALRAHQEAINRLNVYPVPDGDTGTNMALTLESVVAELDGADADLAAVCKAISHGSLMGARGNSRRDPLADPAGPGRAAGRAADAVDAAALARRRSTPRPTAAYEAVMRPVEGTILTVVREVAEAPRPRRPTGADARRRARGRRGTQGAEALARTPELLPVLAEAGRGRRRRRRACCCSSTSLLHVVDGRPLPERRRGRGASADSGAACRVACTHGGGPRRRGRPPLRGHVLPRGARRGHRRLQGRVGRHRRLDRRRRRRRHLELPHPHRRHRCRRSRPPSRSAARARSGSPTCSRRSRRSGGCARPSRAPAEPATSHDPVPTAVVAVATGDGIRRIFHSLGVQGIVTGGQTMNPSTAQLLEAVEAAPGRRGRHPAQQQEHHPGGRAGRRHDHRRRCAWCPPEGVAEGFAALLGLRPRGRPPTQRRRHGRGGRRRGGR